MRRIPTLAGAAFVAAALLLSTAGDPPASAHEGATGVVLQRMESMKSIGDAMKRLSSMYRGEAAYDPAVLRESAEAIGRHGGERMTDLFPDGTVGHPSEALPTIWQDWARFSELADDLSRYAGALAEAADAEEMPPRSTFARLGRVCRSCHTEFRKAQ